MMKHTCVVPSDPYTEHPTREGKVYCGVVLDTFSRRVVGWSIESRPCVEGVDVVGYLACVSGEPRPRRPPTCTAPYLVRGVHAILPECICRYIDRPGCHHEA